MLACAAVVFGWGRDAGAYYTVSWPLLGVLVAGLAGGALLAGLRPARWVAVSAAFLAAFGTWSLLSTSWGGLPDDAWRTFDQALIGAAALIAGSMLSRGSRRRSLLVLGVTAGLVLQAVELLYRLQAGPVPASWLDGRKVQGPVGYHNAQAAFFALGVPLALCLASRPRLWMRCFGGASAALMAGALLVTQSRGAILVLVAALFVQAVVARDLRLAALEVLLAGYGALLIRPLRHVDTALVGSETARPGAVRHYDVWVIAGMIVFGALAATSLRREAVRRVLVVGTAVMALASVSALVVVHQVGPGSIRAALRHAIDEGNPTNLPGGSTRLGSLSLSGRVSLWRVAARMTRTDPLIGMGQGQFARVWGVERDNKDSYVLQPHSIELEASSQLGVVGAAAFAGFGAFGLIALLRGRTGRQVRAAGVAALLVLILQASIDWTFSFPALVVDTLLVVGAAAGGARRWRAGNWLFGAQLVAVLAVFVAMGGPYLAAHRLEGARAANESDPVKAWHLASSARAVDPWSPEVASFQGLLAEAAGRYVLAARRYRQASELSLQPWVDEYHRARALRQAGRLAESRASCRRAIAENPLEPTLREGVCSGVS